MNVKCAVCGQLGPNEKMILRRLNGRNHFCCSISCEVRWEKVNLVGICG
ncbi:hypothetical protein [Geobacter sp. DSM 9736]|nr:hypothetical protein [Geobacter sp. DSM 9736]SNB45196.1 hypothetical protein SAMN06269301_0599 [Geobacter sp. DSM 9736]